jgi:phosphatidylglycerol:prolipoprotein diacylglycerol transferase
MYPHLFQLPAFILAALAGAVLGVSFASSCKKLLPQLAAGAAGALIAGVFAYSREWGHNAIPVQSYGTMILVGFIVGATMMARRAPLVGVESRHAVDIGVGGVFVGLFGARVLDIIMNWNMYSPFHANGFDVERVLDMFKLWKGGLVFYGTFIIVIPYGVLYCRYYKIKPAMPFLDICIIGVIVGLAFGRIGCFLNGCCFGKVCAWGVQFPARDPNDAPAHLWHVAAHLIPPEAQWSLPVYPTQLFASVAAGLTAAFLWFYWPHRKYDGQIMSLALIMVGATRFFEEALRDDEGAIFPAFSAWMTLAQFMAILLVASGFAAMFYFRGRSHGKSAVARLA